MAKKRRKNKLPIASRRFLYREFWTLYLYSPKARNEFWRLLLFPKHKGESFFYKFSHSLFKFAEQIAFRIKVFYSHSLTAHILVAVAVFSAASICIQLLYPANRALPLARLQASGYVGFAEKKQIEYALRDFDQRLVTVHTHDKDLTTSYTDLGITISSDKTFQKINNYSFEQRLIPFSILFVGNTTANIDRTIDQAKLDLYVKDLVGQRNKDPVDARIERSGTKINVIQAEDGYRYEKAALESKILRADLKNNANLVFEPTVLRPKIPTYTANSQASILQNRINAPLIIVADDKTRTIDSETMASWSDITPKPEQGTIDAWFNKAKIADSIRSFANEVNYGATPNRITLLNGMEAGRVSGKNGRSLQFDNLVEQIYGAKSAVTNTIQASVISVPPGDSVDRKYTKDSMGLQTLLDYWTKNNKGEYSIDVRDVNGKIQANVNSSRHFSAIGIYRIYIAHSIYAKISAGSISGNTTTSTGRSVDYCLDKMLYDSNESCTNALGDIVGWGQMDSMLSAQGFESTTLVRGASITSANDAADWMYKLNNRSLSSQGQADTIFSILSRQTERSGLPAGVSGIRVANKAGSLGKYKHDVGMFYHPKGKYIVAVLSENSTFAKIAELSREIERVFNQ